MNIRISFLALALALSSALAFSQVTLYIANDLGRNGYYRQKPIAELMGRMAEEDGPEAVLALGDVHHFEGVQSVDDPLWMTNYETIYSHPELMIPWYAICGNHEYRGNTQAVIDYSDVSRRWNMPQRYYTKTFVDKGTSVKVVFLDTTPLIDKYRNDSTTYLDAGKQSVQNQITWLKEELEHPQEDWVVVVGHHPIYAHTPKAESEREDMQRLLQPLLENGNVDFYVCGHIHNFQHIRPQGSKVDYVVNSAGSLSRKKVEPVQGTVFCSGEPGFSRLIANKDLLVIEMIDSQGNVIHRIERQK